MFVSLNLLTKMSPVRCRTDKFTCYGLYEQGIFLLKTFKDINNNIFEGVGFSISHFLVTKSQIQISREFSVYHPDKLQLTYLIAKMLPHWQQLHSVNPLHVTSVS